MFTQNTREESVLPFFCTDCSFLFLDRCKGPESIETHFREDKSVHGCKDLSRREKAFSDTYDRIQRPYVTSHQDRILLPPFIPMVGTGLNLKACIGIEIFAVTLKNIVSRNGLLLINSIAELRRRLGLQENCKIILVCTAKDELLQRLWLNSDKNRIWEQIANLGFWWVTSFSFSVWDDDPRVDQIVNQDRNFLTHDYLVELGVPTIPFVFPYNDEDYESFGKWMASRRDIRIVAIFASNYQSERQYQQLLANMRKIQAYADRELKFLVVGACTKAKITHIMSEFKACIVASKPWQAAKSGEVCGDDLSYFGRADPKYIGYYEKSRDELALVNMKRHLRFCDSFRKAKTYKPKKAVRKMNHYVEF